MFWLCINGWDTKLKAEHIYHPMRTRSFNHLYSYLLIWKGKWHCYFLLEIIAGFINTALIIDRVALASVRPSVPPSVHLRSAAKSKEQSLLVWRSLSVCRIITRMQSVDRLLISCFLNVWLSYHWFINIFTLTSYWLWQWPIGKQAVQHWASMLRWIWSI